METTHDVIVIGAGLAGLTAAATAVRSGASVLVLDRQGPGGRATTDERGGALVNRGAHALYKGGPASAVLKRLGVNVRGSAPPLAGASVWLDGEVHRLPTGLRFSAAPWLGKREAAQLARWIATLAAHRKPETRLAPASAARWLVTRDLRPRAQLVAEALVRVTSYCSDLEAVSADAIAHQLAIGSYPGVLYLDGGWRQLVDGLSRLIPPVRRTKAESVVDSPGGYLVHTDDGTFRSRTVVLATESAAATHRLLDDLADPADVASPAGVASPATVACLDLVVEQPPTPRFVLGLDEPVYLSLHSPPAELSAPTVVGPARKLHVVHLMRYGARSAAEDRPLLEGVARLAGLDPDEAISGRFLADMTVASAVPSPLAGGLAGRPEITALGRPGCFVAGDWVGPEGMLADTSFASGERAGSAAASIAQGDHPTDRARRRHGADSTAAA